MFQSKMVASPTKNEKNSNALCDLQRIALHGCESAAKVFQTHSKRPYFKKIDLLCDRLKQDLSVTNKAVVNINSHGIAWAIKDFIFVFNRIMNAWIIMRDYYYSNSEGMQCVKDSMDPSFQEDFLKWQEATESLAKSLVQSYENLHQRDQRNGNRKGGKDSESSKNPPTSASKPPMLDPFQKLFDPLISENSEQAQLSGGYLKSAVYKPLSSSEGSTPPDTPGSSHDPVDYDSFKLLFDDLLSEDGSSLTRSGNPKPLYKRCVGDTTPSTKNNSGSKARNLKMNLSNKFEALSVKDSGVDLDGIHPLVNEDDEKDFKQLPMAGLFNFDSLCKLYGDEGAIKVIRLVNDVMMMPESICFLSPSEGKKFPHLPNFIQHDEILSLTVVISNIQDSKYSSLRDVFIAIKMMAEYAKALSQYYQQEDEHIKQIICRFVQGIESFLARYA